MGLHFQSKHRSGTSFSSLHPWMLSQVLGRLVWFPGGNCETVAIVAELPPSSRAAGLLSWVTRSPGKHESDQRQPCGLLCSSLGYRETWPVAGAHKQLKANYAGKNGPGGGGWLPGAREGPYQTPWMPSILYSTLPSKDRTTQPRMT